MSVTYRDLPKEIDPIAFLFDDEKITVPESYFTPELIARFYERSLRTLDVKSLHNKSDQVPYGLVSLPSLLRYEPVRFGPKWLKLEASKEIIENALPSKTPYQLQYLNLFGFPLPKWEDVPLVTWRGKRPFNGRHRVFGNIYAVALLFGKNEQLYFVTARWTPIEKYFGGGKEPRYLEEGPYVFRLTYLSIEATDWSDGRVLKRIRDGQWSDIAAFRANLYSVLSCTADVLETRAGNMRRSAERLRFDGMLISYGR